MDYEAEGIWPKGRLKKTWESGYRKRLSDPTNMQGRWYDHRKYRKLIKDFVY